MKRHITWIFILVVSLIPIILYANQGTLIGGF